MLAIEAKLMGALGTDEGVADTLGTVEASGVSLMEMTTASSSDSVERPCQMYEVV